MNDLARTTANGSTGATFETRVSLYDRVSAGLIALLVLGLFLFAVLFSIWWFQTPLVNRTSPPPSDPTTTILPNTDEEINVKEYDGSESQAFKEVMELTGTSVAEISQATIFQSDGTGIGISGNGDGPGTGTGREPGPGGRAPKWSVVQEASDLEDYQRKLDFFAIEIGAVHKSNDKIWRIAQLSAEKVVTESSRSAESKPRHFVNKRKRLLQWDLQTIAQAGVDLQDIIPVHFYPAELIIKMQQLIDAQYQDRTSDLKQVTFKIVGTPGDFHFEIEAAQFNN